MSLPAGTAEWPATGRDQRRFLVRWSAFALFALVVFALEIVTLTREGGARKPLGWSFHRPAGVWTVRDVDPAGPAASLLRDGDRIVAIDGDAAAARIGPRWYLRDSPARTSYAITVQRDGVERRLTVPWPTVYEHGEHAWQWVHLATGLVYLAFSLLVAFARPDSMAAQRAVTVNMLTLGFFVTLALETETGIVSHVPLVLALGYYFVRPLHMYAAYRFTANFPLGDQRSPAWRRTERIFLVAGILIWLPSVYGGSLRALGPERATAIAAAQYPFSLVHDTLLGGLAFLYAGVASLLNALVCWRNYRLLPPGDLQRRLKWVSIGIVVGILPLALVGPFLFVRSLASDSERLTLIVHVVNTAVVLIPICMGYAVVKHRVLGIRVVVRAGVRYLLARNVLRVALALPLLLLALAFARHPDRSVGELLALNGGTNVALLVLAALALRYRAPLMSRIDRHFFREAYQRDQVFVSLAEAVGRADDIPALARLLSTQLDLALHPTRVLALTRRSSGAAASGALDVVFASDGRSGPASVEALGRASSELQDVDGVAELRTLAVLSVETRALLERLGVALVVPVRGPNEGLVGVLLLGEKRSEEPYTRDDRRLLDTAAAQTGVVWENLMLRQVLVREQAVRRQLASRLDEGAREVVMECSTCGRCYDGDVARCEADGHTLAPSLPGSRLLDGKYRLERVVGRGGMGSVYQATDTRLERTVAVKVLLGSMFDESVARQRFAREARASARIDHPNVVGVYDFGELDGGAYLVLEYLRGETLRQRLDRDGPLDGALLDRVLAGLFEGVAAAHAHGVVHRDLKPENVFLSCAEGASVDDPASVVAKVLDFGLAIGRDVELTEGGRLTRTGTAVGTLAYMSPEQLLGEPVDERTDIHALGIIVLEALTGSLDAGGPFFARADAVLAERLGDDSERAREIARAVRRAVHERREERHPSVSALRTDLLEAMARVPVT